MNKKSDDRYTFNLWIPDLFDNTGGIQVYSSFFLQALLKIYPEANYEIFIKHDSLRLKTRTFFNQNTNFYCFGRIHFSLRTWAFAAKLISIGLWKFPNVIITTHLNFLPIAYLLKRFTNIPYWTFDPNKVVILPNTFDANRFQPR